MLLTTFDVDLEIERRTLGLKIRHTDPETGKVNWDAYDKEHKIIIDEAWKEQGEIMRAQFASVIEDAEAQVDADMRYAEFLCTQNAPNIGFPMWTIPFIVCLVLCWAWLIAG